MTPVRVLLATAVAVLIAAPFIALSLVCDAVINARHERRKRGLVVLRGGKL